MNDAEIREAFLVRLERICDEVARDVPSGLSLEDEARALGEVLDRVLLIAKGKYDELEHKV